MHALVDFLKEFTSHNWVSSSTTFVMHISAPIREFFAQFSHTTVTLNITVYTAQFFAQFSHTTVTLNITVYTAQFFAQFSHTTVTHNITVYTTQSTMNLARSLSVCMKKTNHSTYLTAGGSGDDSVHDSSEITPTLRSENVWGQAFSDNKRYLLLLSVRFGAMTKPFFFLPINRRLILELPTYI